MCMDVVSIPFAFKTNFNDRSIIESPLFVYIRFTVRCWFLAAIDTQNGKESIRLNLFETFFFSMRNLRKTKTFHNESFLSLLANQKNTVLL